MVKLTQNMVIPSNASQIDTWLSQLALQKKYTRLDLIREACGLVQLAGESVPTITQQNCLQKAFASAQILIDLHLDEATIAAALLYDCLQYTDLTLHDIQEQMGNEVAKLLQGVRHIDALNMMRKPAAMHTHAQMENLRKMLIDIVEDVRVVLIKLADRLQTLRTLSNADHETQQTISQETMTVFAPLANRLGIGQIKWEMEDLAFRYLHPNQYKEIAAGLQAKRIDRDNFVTHIKETLSVALKQAGIAHANISGRAKHIHSIYRKMQRKNLPIKEIYDVIAVRILVDTVEDCYTVLSLVHEHWQNISSEFDDYIVQPKANGYRSLHTAVKDEHQRVFEVQIRTDTMHQEAELGFAAHWLYKERGSVKQESNDQKVQRLRQVLEWQQEIAATQTSALTPDESDYLTQRIYAFTPGGDIIDLPQGATPLDFAYHIHTEIGHRCRGAKVANHIVPLTYQLKTGDQVEIMTSKQARPSRDWLNIHAGYLQTSRARAKAHHWFKQLDYDKDCAKGTEMMEQALHKLHFTKSINYNVYASHFNFKKGLDILAAIGRGDLKIQHMLNLLDVEQHTKPTPLQVNRVETVTAPEPSQAIQIKGIDNLLNHMAKCCKPIPGDNIIGYITQGRGISVHRSDCTNIKSTQEEQKKRLIEINWGKQIQDYYPIDIIIAAQNRANLLRDITQQLANEKTQISAINTQFDKHEQQVTLRLTLEIKHVTDLKHLLDKLKQIDGINFAQRLQP